MRQVDKKKEKDKVAIVLMLCFCVVALTSIFTIKSNIDKISENNGGALVSDRTLSERENVEKESAKDESDIAETGNRVSVVDSLDKKNKGDNPFISPVKASKGASVMKEYSMDMVIYSTTLDQFMTHSGTDIAADEDTQVLAIADGTVTDVRNDQCYGITIEITHDNGYISTYSNLTTDKMVEKGDTVEQGQIISGVGRSALFESMDPAHVHLEITKNGELINPADIISF